MATCPSCHARVGILAVARVQKWSPEGTCPHCGARFTRTWFTPGEGVAGALVGLAAYKWMNEWASGLVSPEGAFALLLAVLALLQLFVWHRAGLQPVTQGEIEQAREAFRRDNHVRPWLRRLAAVVALPVALILLYLGISTCAHLASDPGAGPLEFLVPLMLVLSGCAGLVMTASALTGKSLFLRG